MANPLKGDVIRLYKTATGLQLRTEEVSWMGDEMSSTSTEVQLPQMETTGILLHLGREYPQGSAYFKERLKSAFMKNKDETDPDKIKQLVARGDFVIKELEALYFLRKYRAMKKRYYEPEE